MDFYGFDWDTGNLEKCRKHGVSVDEIESVFAGPTVILPDEMNSAVERRFRAVGQTAKRRPAFIVFTYRLIGGAMSIRVISARYMHRTESENYEKAYPQLQNR